MTQLRLNPIHLFQELASQMVILLVALTHMRSVSFHVDAYFDAYVRLFTVKQVP
jgi:hypothetical protein